MRDGMPQSFSRVSLCLLCLLGSVGSASAGVVTLSWAPSPEPDVAGYVVHYGTGSRRYSFSVDVGQQTSFQFREPDPSIRYYLAVRAYNASGVQSGFSQEVSTTPAGTLVLTGVRASVAAPLPVGTAIKFSATASGTAAAPQYKWFTFDGLTWTLRQNWSRNSTFTWTPSAASPNTAVSVWARTGTADAPDNNRATASLSFPITPPPTPVAITSLSASKRAPQALGNRMTFAAQASGATAVEFKWWVFNGEAWTVVQEWSSSNRFSWLPAAANAGYRVLVRARDARNGGTSTGTSMSFPIVRKP